ncbi:MAG TPA: hypothetical protein VGV16_06725 [Gammaproteobacteria bacterium]|nr:hypothetical protein [Gammaproteobacteria bacterium]
MKWIAVGVAFPMLLSGCAPYAVSYYEPNADSGMPFRGMCHSGPISNIEFTRGDRKLFVYSRFKPHTDHDFSIDLQLGLLPTDSGSVNWHDAQITLPNGGDAQVTIESYAYNLPYTNSSPRHTIDTDTVDGSKFAGYDYVLIIHSQLPDEFTYTVPMMTIDGITYPSTDVRFVRKSGFWIVPINC